MGKTTHTATKEPAMYILHPRFIVLLQLTSCSYDKLKQKCFVLFVSSEIYMYYTQTVHVCSIISWCYRLNVSNVPSLNMRHLVGKGIPLPINLLLVSTEAE